VPTLSRSFLVCRAKTRKLIFRAKEARGTGFFSWGSSARVCLLHTRFRISLSIVVIIVIIIGIVGRPRCGREIRAKIKVIYFPARCGMLRS